MCAPWKQQLILDSTLLTSGSSCLAKIIHQSAVHFSQPCGSPHTPASITSLSVCAICHYLTDAYLAQLFIQCVFCAPRDWKLIEAGVTEILVRDREVLHAPLGKVGIGIRRSSWAQRTSQMDSLGNGRHTPER